MKKIIVVLIAFLMASCAKVTETQYAIGSKHVFLIITENTTETELIKIANEFKSQKNIVVDFSKTEFLENGKIEKLNLEVDCGDGYKGLATSTGEILKSKNSGFSRNYSENAIEPFVIGAM